MTASNCPHCNATMLDAVSRCERAIAAVNESRRRVLDVETRHLAAGGHIVAAERHAAPARHRFDRDSRLLAEAAEDMIRLIRDGAAT